MLVKFELQDLSPDGLKSFLDAKGVPLIVEMNKDPANHAALVKFFNGVGTKVSWAEPHTFHVLIFSMTPDIFAVHC